MEVGDEKLKQWSDLESRIEQLQRGGRKGLKALTDHELSRLIDRYQTLTADLARARSLEAPRSIVDRLNRIAVAGHIALYGQSKTARKENQGHWFGGIARAVRGSLWAVGLSAALFFGSGVLTYFAVQASPTLGFDLVPDGFIEFDPAREDNLHNIPGLARPIASSAIMGNNIQVTLLLFGFGLTAGIGTTWLLVFNGVHIGAVAGWMTLNGQAKALWGWIMPHGGTELLAICLAGAAGFLLAGAILSPGQVSRSTALKQAGGRALMIELGCMIMLVIAGLIEGFVSPSSIGYPARISILVISLLIWFLYFGGVGHRKDGSQSTA